MNGKGDNSFRTAGGGGMPKLLCYDGESTFTVLITENRSETENFAVVF